MRHRLMISVNVHSFFLTFSIAPVLKSWFFIEELFHKNKKRLIYVWKNLNEIVLLFLREENVSPLRNFLSWAELKKLHEILPLVIQW